MPRFSPWKLLINDGRINGVLAEGSDGVQWEIEAGLVVGADGHQSRIAERARFDAKVKPRLDLPSLAGGVCQPFGRLEGPAAPDAQSRSRQNAASPISATPGRNTFQIKLGYSTTPIIGLTRLPMGPELEKAEQPSRSKCTCRRP